MSGYTILATFELGFIYAILALGIFLSYRILKITDLTMDASFVTGSAIYAVCAQAGIAGPGFLTAFGGGMLAGAVSALLHIKGKIPPILAGIITMTGFYSINARILGNKANISLFHLPGLLHAMPLGQRFLLLAGIALVCAGILYWFLLTRLGMNIRAVGENEQMVRTLGINPDQMKFIGMILSNGLVALAGALITTYQQFADLNGGVGIMVMGMVSVILAEAMIPIKQLGVRIFSVIAGSVAYRFILTLALQLGIQAVDLKLLCAIFLTVALLAPNRLGGKRHASHS